MMDEEMEGTYEYTFTAVEIDLDYEFDAASFFDFCSGESPAEARDSERWFDSAGSYPPSPFVTKLLPREDMLLENVNTSPKSKNGDGMDLSDNDSDVDVNEGVSTMEQNIYDAEREREPSVDAHAINLQKFQTHIQKIRSGLTIYNRIIKDNLTTKTKASVKPSFPRSSTLMKPTASQLAKQNKPQQMGGLRFQKSLADKNQKSSGNPCVIEVQAPKRQKLEGGVPCKVGEAMQQTNFVHKAPKKDGAGDINVMPAKLRITIPREPDLETAHRAERMMRPKTTNEAANVKSTIPRFKARPLNRKIFEAPTLLLPKRRAPQLPEFQEFHLRTLERATQHASATSTSTVPCSNSNKVLHKLSTNSTAECGNIESRRSKLLDSSKEDACEVSYTFKALPLNKKIFTSKGDIGVFRNTKKETTVPMEFNFQTEKRAHNPPVELFNKLSLASNPQPSIGSELKPPRPTCSAKVQVLKENRWGFVSKAHEIKHAAKEKLLWSGGKQNQNQSSNGRTTEVGPSCGISRNLGIR